MGAKRNAGKRELNRENSSLEVTASKKTSGERLQGESPQGEKSQGKFKQFLQKQNIEITWERYFIKALGAMALGLFASLLIGTIVDTISMIFPEGSFFYTFFEDLGSFASAVTGPAMAIAIGNALNAPPLVLFTLAAVGFAANDLGGAGGPLAVFFVALLACELGKLVSKTTPVDIIVTPFVTLFSGGALAMLIAPWLGKAANAIGSFIMVLTNQQPFIMGILVSILMGILLTLPISSAAIAASFGLVGLAGSAGLAGCCCHMVGFAVMSYRENGVGGLLAQGLGTSMLQMPNILKKPILFLPPIISSAITGPIATVLFKLEMNGPAIASGMGTAGLVGPIGQITGWFHPSEQALEFGAQAISTGFMEWFGLLMITLVLPALLTWLISKLFRKLGWIKEGDLKVQLN